MNISINKLKKERIIFIEKSIKERYLITYYNEEIKVYKNLCPHMGAFFSKKNYNSKDQTLTCPWHGYIYSLQNGKMIKNPAEGKWFSELTDNNEYFCPKNISIPSHRYSIVDNEIIIE